MVKVSSLDVSFQRDWVLSDTNPSSRSTNNMFCTLSGVELWKLNLQAKVRSLMVSLQLRSIRRELLRELF